MSPQQFVAANTRLLAVPLVPELKLHLAEESLPIWQRSEEELGAMNVPPPYWAFAWAGGQAVGRYILDNPAVVAGRCVLDLGAGSGLGAVAAARAGGRRVVAADIDPFALAAIALNAAANGVDVAATSDDLLATGPPACDVLLIGDLFYERPLAERVLAFAQAAHIAGCDVLVGDPRRSYFPQERFREVVHYAVPVTRELEDSEIKHSAVWRLR